MGHVLGSMLFRPFTYAMERSESRAAMRREIDRAGAGSADAILAILVHHDPLRLEGLPDEASVYGELAVRMGQATAGSTDDVAAVARTLRRIVDEMSTDVLFDGSRRRFRLAAAEIVAMRTAAERRPA